jgi:hypothetical protein
VSWSDWLPWRKPARPTGPAATAPPPAPPGWCSVPPVQRTLAPMPVTAPVSRLAPALNTWADPRLLTSLGHVVDPDGPSGWVEGLLRPARGPAVPPGGPELPPTRAPEVRRGTGRTTVQRSRSALCPPPAIDEAPRATAAGAGPHAASSGDAPLANAPGPVSEEAPSRTLPPATPAPDPRRLTEAAPVRSDPVVRPVVPVQRAVGDVPVAPPDEPGTATGGAAAPPPVEVAPLTGGVPAPAYLTPASGGPTGTSAAPSRAELPGTPLAVQRAASRPEPGPEYPAGGTAPAGRTRRSRIGAPLPGPVDLQRLDTPPTPAAGPQSPVLPVSPTVLSPPPAAAGPDGESPAAAPSGAGAPVGHAGSGDETPGVPPAADVAPPVEAVRGLVGGLDDGSAPAARHSVQRAADEGAAPRGPVGHPVDRRAAGEGSVQWLLPDEPLPLRAVPALGRDGPGAAVQRTVDPVALASPAGPAVPGPSVPGPPVPVSGVATGDGSRAADPDGGSPAVQRATDPAGRPGTAPSPSSRDDGTVAGASPDPDPGPVVRPEPFHTIPLLGERPLTGTLLAEHGGPVPAAVQRSTTGSPGGSPDPVVGAPRPGSTAGTVGSGSAAWVAGNDERVVVARWETPDSVVSRWAAGADLSGPGAVRPGSSAGPGSPGPGGAGPGAAAGESPAPGVPGAGTAVGATGTWSGRPGGAAVGETAAPAVQRVREPGPASVRSTSADGEPVAPAALLEASVQRAADPGSVAVAAGVAVREADGSVVFLPPATSGAPGTTGAASEALPVPPVASRGTASGTTGAGSGAPPLPPPAPAVQRQAAAVAAPDPPAADLGGTGEGPVPTAPFGTPPAAAGAPPPDLDELARRLFDPLSARLRAELRLDRERAGVVTDLRH